MCKLKKQYEVLNWASSFLKKYHREESVAPILLQHYLHISNATFYANMQENLPHHVVKMFVDAIKKHALKGVPAQHLTGKASFYGREFHVNDAVLIPRFETEELVEHVMNTIQSISVRQPILVDVGTGSGVIAITLKLEIPDLIVYATDISEKALQRAKQNARLHQASVHFLKGNFLFPIIGMKLAPHIIVSNPPYISYTEKDELADTVKSYDPEIALFADENGLAAYRTIISQSTQLDQQQLELIAFEIGYTQKDAVCAFMHEAYPYGKLQVIQDLNEKDRIIIKNVKSSL